MSISADAIVFMAFSNESLIVCVAFPTGILRRRIDEDEFGQSQRRFSGHCPGPAFTTLSGPSSRSSAQVPVSGQRCLKFAIQGK